MTFDRRHRYTLYSLLIFSLLTGFLFAFPLDSDFTGFGLFFMTEAVGIFVGGISIILRLLKIRLRKTLFYSYFGTLNLILGVILTVCGILNYKFAYPVFLTLNLLIGGIILCDIFRSITYQDKVKMRKSLQQKPKHQADYRHIEDKKR